MPVLVPTFNLTQPMGLGKLGDPSIIIKRKFRYTLEIEQGESSSCQWYIPPHFVKLAARPQLEIDETELNFLNAVTWVPGKGRWQPLTVTYIDVSTAGVENASMDGLYKWLTTVYNFMDNRESFLLRQAEKRDWIGTATLRMFDGCGTPLETWILKSVWPQSINFGDLDYGDSEVATIELTLRYSDVIYERHCGLPGVESCCSGCSESSQEGA